MYMLNLINLTWRISPQLPIFRDVLIDVLVDI